MEAKKPKNNYLPQPPKPKFAGSIRKYSRANAIPEWYFLCGCGTKGINYYDYRPCIQCDVCKIWKHVKCAGFPEDVFKLADEMRKRRIWVCSDCKSGNFNFVAKIWSCDEDLKVNGNENVVNEDDSTKTIEEREEYERELAEKKEIRRNKLKRMPTAYCGAYDSVDMDKVDQMVQESESKKKLSLSPRKAKKSPKRDSAEEKNGNNDEGDNNNNNDVFKKNGISRLSPRDKKKSPKQSNSPRNLEAEVNDNNEVNEENMNKKKVLRKGKSDLTSNEVKKVKKSSDVKNEGEQQQQQQNGEKKKKKKKKTKNVSPRKLRNSENDAKIDNDNKNIENENNSEEQNIRLISSAPPAIRIIFSDDVDKILEENSTMEPHHDQVLPKKSILKPPTVEFLDPSLPSPSDYQHEPGHIIFKESPKERIQRAGRTFIRSLSVY